MSDGLPHDHISRISTIWTLVLQAHGDDSEAIAAAQSRMIERYSGAVYRYLVKILRNSDAADDVFQEFALRFVRGGFRHANPQRGRFRDYLKTALLRLVSDYRRSHRGREKSLGEAEADVPADIADPESEFDRQFCESCRDELLSRAWDALKILEEQTGRPFHAVLSYRTEHPGCTSEQMAVELTSRLGSDRPLSSAGVRKTLQRAREKFAELLLYEVTQMIGENQCDILEQELIDLELLVYCRSVFKQRYA